MAYNKIRPRRATKAQWEYYNPVLSLSELAFEVPDSGAGTGLCNVKIGDGVTPWINLPYALKGSGGVDDTKIGLDSTWSSEYIKNYIDELMLGMTFADFVINSFSCDKQLSLIGSMPVILTFNWSLSATPKSLTIESQTVYPNNTVVKFESINPYSTSCIANVTWSSGYKPSINDTIEVVLKASPPRGTSVTKNIFVEFANYIYYGVGGSSIKDTSGLEKTLTNSKSINFTTTSNDGQYIYFLFPKRLGNVAFFKDNITGFEAGFSKQKEMSITINNFTEEYLVYRSNYDGLTTLMLSAVIS